MDEPGDVLLAVAGVIAGSLLATAVLLMLWAATKATWRWFASGQWWKDLWP